MNKIERDKQTILLMIDIYCKRCLKLEEMPQHYRLLGEYACKRLDYCRYGSDKPACKDCETHCYRPDMATEMRRIMRWVGPRMLFYSPKATLRHLWQTIESKLNKR